VARGSLSGFFFDVEAWFGSVSVQRMSYAERGVYKDMLCQEWRDPSRSLPDDPEAVADLIAVTPQHRADVLVAWPIVRQKFVADRRQLKRMINVRLEHTRRVQQQFRTKRELAGQSGGKRKAANAQKLKALLASKAIAPLDFAIAKPSVEAVANVESSRVGLGRVEVEAATAAVSARSKRPIYTSDRFAVFEWQLDELAKMLGSHLDAFDLHAFFDAIAQQSRASGLVIPRADVWPWLQAQVLAEVQRRGLPLATAGTSDEARFQALIAKGPSRRP
jgi:uncharacterized protein YdaU (DUF1376 family)